MLDVRVNYNLDHNVDSGPMLERSTFSWDCFVEKRNSCIFVPLSREELNTLVWVEGVTARIGFENRLALCSKAPDGGHSGSWRGFCSDPDIQRTRFREPQGVNVAVKILEHAIEQ